jgi:hypothetical protein
VKGRNILVTGDARSGKSWVTGLLCEQLVLHGYCVCVLDPEGDYRSLEGLPGVSVVGGEDPPPTPRELLRALRYPDRSLVIDLSHLPLDAKIEYVASVLPLLNVLRRRTGLPHRVVIDEAHYFLGSGNGLSQLDPDLNGYTIVTYCGSKLPQQLLRATEVVLTTCQSRAAEVDALCQCCARSAEVDAAAWRVQLSHLGVGTAVALPITQEAEGELKAFTLGKRLTPHVRHREKYVDVPVSDQRAFVFAPGRAAPANRVRTLREFADAVQSLAPTVLAGYLTRGDFSRWIGDVFGDHALAAALREQEDRFRRGHTADVIVRIIDAIRSRYDLADSARSEPVPAPGSSSDRLQPA